MRYQAVELPQAGPVRAPTEQEGAGGSLRHQAPPGLVVASVHGLARGGTWVALAQTAASQVSQAPSSGTVTASPHSSSRMLPRYSTPPGTTEPNTDTANQPWLTSCGNISLTNYIWP